MRFSEKRAIWSENVVLFWGDLQIREKKRLIGGDFCEQFVAYRAHQTPLSTLPEDNEFASENYLGIRKIN